MNDDQCSDQNCQEASKEEITCSDILEEFQSFFSELQVFDSAAMCPPSPKRPRRTYDEKELDRLETVFAVNSYPDREHRAALAKEMGVSPKHIQIWFQNRRARERIQRRKAEGIVENPIDRMRIQLIQMPPPSLQQMPTTENHKAPAAGIATKSSVRPSTSIHSASTEVNSQQQQQLRIPLRTIACSRNVSQQNLETPVPNNTSANPENSINQFVALQPPMSIALTAASSLSTATSLDNSQFSQVQAQQPQPPSSGKLNAMTVGAPPASYHVSLGSISNLSDISNSSFTELMSTVEHDELLFATDSTYHHFSPNFDFVFDF